MNYTPVTLGNGQVVYVDTLGNFFDASGAAVPNQAVASNTFQGPFANLLQATRDYLEQLKQRGHVLNPNVELTPERVADFTHQAEQEINPYYANQLKQARYGLLRSIGYSTEQIARRDQLSQETYRNRLRAIGERAAERGFALSGVRKRQEAQLASDTQRSLDEARNRLGYNSTTAGLQFARQYGTANLPSASVGVAPRVISGQPDFAQAGETLPLYQLSPEVYDGLVGASEYNRRAAVQNRAAQLEGAFRATQALAQERQLL